MNEVEIQGFQFLALLVIAYLWFLVVVKEKWTGFIIVGAGIVFFLIGLALSLIAGPLSLIFGIGIIEAAGFMVFFGAIAIVTISIFDYFLSFGRFTYEQVLIKVTKLAVSDFLQVTAVTLLSYGWFRWIFIN